MSDSEPIGQLIDSLGVVHTPREGELVSGVVILLKVIDENGGVSMRTAWSDGMSWIERVGMLRVAERVDLPPQGDGWSE